jgi:hypothetical protein
VRAGLLGTLALPLLTSLAAPAMQQVAVCRALAPALVPLLVAAHRTALLAGAALQEDRAPPQPWAGGQPVPLPLLADLALTLRCLVTASLGVLWEGGPGEQGPPCLLLLRPPFPQQLDQEAEQELQQEDGVADEEVWRLPVLRPSLAALLEPRALERGIRALAEALQVPGAGPRLAALLRGLQAGAELEGRWQEEVQQVL